MEKQCHCGKFFKVKLSHFHKRISCSKECARIRARKLGIYSGKNNPAYGKTYRTKITHPEWAEKVSATHKEKGSLIGDKNPMKRPEVAKKQSVSRIKMFKENPEMRENLSNQMKIKWASGELDGTATGKCKWYTHIQPNGNTCKLQGTWEVALARHFDELAIEYIAHRGRFDYLIENENISRSYLPDFYIPKLDVYIDVKGAFWNSEQKDKIGWIRKSNPNLNLIIATKEILNTWNVKLNETQAELLKTNHL
jgi:hypothetical protein